MSAPRISVSSSPLAADPPQAAWGTRLYRYFFYAWLFRDADAGNSWERAAAMRHNQSQARWLPTYLFRWSVAGAVLVALEQMSEAASGDSFVSAMLALLLIFTVMYLLITTIIWAFLHADRRQS